MKTQHLFYKGNRHFIAEYTPFFALKSAEQTVKVFELNFDSKTRKYELDAEGKAKRYAFTTFTQKGCSYLLDRVIPRIAEDWTEQKCIEGTNPIKELEISNTNSNE